MNDKTDLPEFVYKIRGAHFGDILSTTVEKFKVVGETPTMWRVHVRAGTQLLHKFRVYTDLTVLQAELQKRKDTELAAAKRRLAALEAPLDITVYPIPYEQLPAEKEKIEFN